MLLSQCYMSKEYYSDRSSDRGKSHGQRSLVLQGGRALGAYQAGVIRGLCKRLTEKNDKEKGKDNRRPLFDIVAMNAAVLVGNVVKKDKTWIEAAEELETFWKEGIALKEGVTAVDDIVPVGCFKSFLGGSRGQSTFLRGRHVQIKQLRLMKGK
jgi:hypothetical protein